MRFIINPPVFFGSVGLIAILLAVGVFLPGQAEAMLSGAQAWLLTNFGWFYLLAVGLFLLAAAVLCVGRYGDLKLGPDDCEPDFKFGSWVAMLFAAGKGIGLMYYAVAEPMLHYAAPPAAAPLSVAAEQDAMSITFFHWGIHAWAIYAVVGLSLAYFGYRYNLPLTIRSGLYPLLKDRIKGPVGDAVDIFAVCCTVFGLATSLGLGVQQVNGGLNYLFDLPMSVTTQVVLVISITAVATLAVLSGLGKGIRWLSELNIILALGLMLFVLLAGPTVQLMRDLVQNIGLYLGDFLPRTFNLYAYEPTPWVDAWTLFYWAWWMSWAPFVGMFIARISRGRTVREFILAVLLLPSGFTFVWMTVFGNTALFLDQGVAAGALSQAVAADVSSALFKFFEYLPLSGVTSAVAIFMVAIFFISSQSSGSLVMDIIASGGKTETTTGQRLFWCSLEGVVTIVLLVAGGLAALKAATIIAALPFAIVMLVLVFGLFKGMRADVAQHAAGAGSRRGQAQAASGLTWQRRLALTLNTPTDKDVEAFIRDTVRPALDDVAQELTRRGRPAATADLDGRARLVSPAQDVRDFVYGVEPAFHPLPAFSTQGAVGLGRRHEARTFFSDGSRGYDVMGMNREQIIEDVLVQFERYLALTHSPQTTLLAQAPQHGR